MVRGFVKKELRGRYQKSVLGVLWNFLNPLFQILIYTILFTFIFPSNIDDYYIYLTTGLIPWTFFSESLGSGTSSIVNNADMVKKIYFPREILVISSVTAKFINLLISFIIIFAFILISGRGISFKLLPYLIPILIAEFFLALGFALLLSGIDVYFRDMEYIINVLLQAWVWATPIMYELQSINPTLRTIIGFNPMTSIILAFHNVLYYKVSPSLFQLLGMPIIGIIMTIIGELVFLHVEKDFAEEL